MPRTIIKKTTNEYFQLIASGQKTFDVRLADWECEAGDTIVLVEISNEDGRPTGRKLSCTIGSVVRTKDLDFWTPAEVSEHGYQVISLLNIEAPTDENVS